MKCRVCGSESRHEFTHMVLGKFSCGFFYCDGCGFLQTEEPYWLEDAYTPAIADADTGLVQRNLFLSEILSGLLYFVFDSRGKYLDAAGGYGMQTRLMRDVGFNFYWSDKYCENLLARGFEAVSDSSYVAVTAFEALEHVADPIGFLSETMLQAKTRTIIFSTELFDGSPPKPGSWWYYAFETGQHISFFQRRTLFFIAERLGLNCYSNGAVHMLTDKNISSVKYRLLTSPRLSRVFSLVPKTCLSSKTMTDHLDIMRS